MKNSFYEYEVRSLMGENIKLDQFKNKVSLVVNVASKCGYTPQYKELQVLHEKYSEKGFNVLAFPSNDFGAQEPGTAEEIKEFCDLNYGVKFPIFAKNSVKGADKQPVYEFLTTKANPSGEVAWNFEKFLVSREGLIVGRYKSAVKPLDQELLKDIEGAL